MQNLARWLQWWPQVPQDSMMDRRNQRNPTENAMKTEKWHFYGQKKWNRLQFRSTLHSRMVTENWKQRAISTGNIGCVPWEKANCFNRPRDHWTMWCHHHPCGVPYQCGVPNFTKSISSLFQTLIPYTPISILTKLVGGIPTPLKNMSSSVGMMTFPIYGKS